MAHALLDPEVAVTSNRHDEFYSFEQHMKDSGDSDEEGFDDDDQVFIVDDMEDFEVDDISGMETPPMGVPTSPREACIITLNRFYIHPDEKNVFIRAAYNNDYEALYELFRSETCPLQLLNQGTPGDRFSAIYVAAFYGYPEVLEILLENGANVDTVDTSLRTALFVAAYQGYDDCCHVLMEHGASPFAEDVNGDTALHAAAAAGNDHVISFFLQNEATAEELLARRNHSGNTPLHVAVLSGMEQSVATLASAEECIIDQTDFDGRTSLHRAAERGDDVIVDILIRAGASPILMDANDRTALLISAAHGHTECVAILMAADSDLEAKDNHGLTALHRACLHGLDDCVTLLLEGPKSLKDGLAAAVDSVDNQGRTPFHAAACCGSVECCLALLENHADINALDYQGRSPLYYAVLRHPEIADMLIEKGAKVSILDCYGRSMLHYLSYYGNEEMVLSLATDLPVDCHDNRNADTPLHAAVSNGQLDTAAVLAELGANVNAQDKFGRTPLFVAVMRGDIDIVGWLLEAGANINHKDHRGRTCLHAAAYHNQVECTLLLLEHGIDVHTLDNKNRSVLHAAALSGNVEILQIILFDVDGGTSLLTIADKNGRLAHHLASIAGSYEFLSFLVGRQLVSVSARDSAGISALHMAAFRGHSNCFAALLPYGAMVDSCDDMSRTPMHYAAYKGHLQCVKELLAKGADPDWEDEYGQTPLHMACSRGSSYAVVRALVDTGANIHHCDSLGNNALHKAVAAGNNVMIVEYLLTCGCGLSVENNEGKTAQDLLPEESIPVRIFLRKYAELLESKQFSF